ncbi:C2 domain-containing protein 5 isoform X1 [Tachysurus ichikawai]
MRTLPLCRRGVCEIESVPPCSDRAGFGEEAPGVPLCSGPPTPLRAQTFSSFSPSKSYSRQSSSSDTELSLTPKTGKTTRTHGSAHYITLSTELQQISSANRTCRLYMNRSVYGTVHQRSAIRD